MCTQLTQSFIKCYCKYFQIFPSARHIPNQFLLMEYFAPAGDLGLEVGNQCCALNCGKSQTDCLSRCKVAPGCICNIFLQSEFSHVSSITLPQQMQSCIGCISTISHQNEFSNASSICSSQQMHNHIQNTYFAFPHCASLYLITI